MPVAKRLIGCCEAPVPAIRRSCIQPSTLSHAMKAPVSIRRRPTWRLRRRFAYSVASSTLETADPTNRRAPEGRRIARKEGCATGRFSLPQQSCTPGIPDSRSKVLFSPRARRTHLRHSRRACRGTFDYALYEAGKPEIVDVQPAAVQEAASFSSRR